MSWPWNEIFLARHGETEWNVAGRRQGQLDSPLTDRGWADALNVAAIAATLDLDSVFTSPLGRAHKTALITARHVELTVSVVDELSELHHGSLAGMTRAETEEAYPGELDRRDSDKYNWRFPDGESYAELDERVATALKEVAVAATSRPLIVSHAMTMRMLLKNLLGVDAATALAYDVGHQGRMVRVDTSTKMFEWLEPPDLNVTGTVT